MKIGLYPGCSLEGSSREYRESVEAVSKAVGIELADIPDWNCCGATAAHNLNKELSLALPARILAIAEREGLTEVVVPCAACYSRLTVAQHELNNDPVLRSKIVSHIEMEYKGNLNIMNVIQYIDKYIFPKIDQSKIKAYNHRVACYYGCLLVRPAKILKFDRPENPQSMDNVVQRIGGEPIKWNFKTECCGAGHSVSRTDIVAKLSGTIVQDAVDCGAEAIAVACPMCHSNLDMRRPDINKFLGKKQPIPVIYITQAIGLALGLSEKELGMNRHFVRYHIPERPPVVEVETKKPVKKKVEVEAEVEG